MARSLGIRFQPNSFLDFKASTLHSLPNSVISGAVSLSIMLKILTITSGREFVGTFLSGVFFDNDHGLRSLELDCLVHCINFQLSRSFCFLLFFVNECLDIVCCYRPTMSWIPPINMGFLGKFFNVLKVVLQIANK